MDQKTVGRKLRDLRGMNRTIEDVASAVGVTPGAISNYENGRRMPSDDIKLRIARYYGVSVESLFFEAEYT